MAGRPPTEFTDEQIDTAKELLGRRVYTSKVAGELQKKLKLTREMAYKLIGVAQERVFKGLASEGGATDPLTAQYLFLESVVAGKYAIQHRINASLAIIKLLGLGKLLDRLEGAEAEEFVAAIVARRMAREAAAREPPAETSDHPREPVLNGHAGGHR